MCSPTGHHLGVIIDEVVSIEEIISKLKSVGVDAKYDKIQHKLTSGKYVSYDTVVFRFGQWLPPDTSTPRPLEADARLYVGEKSMVLKVNTSLSGSHEPLKKAIALLYKARVISYLQKQTEFMLTEGNRMPADAIIAWASNEYVHDLEQLVFKCQSKGADVIIPSLSTSQEIIVLANGINAELSYPLLRDELIARGLNPSLIGPSELNDHLDAKVLIVLGGPDAYDGVGNISEFLLLPSDSDYLRSESGSYIVYQAQPLFEGQKIFVIAGNDRYYTKRAVEAFLNDFLDDLLGKRPSLKYEFDTYFGLPSMKPIVR